MRKLTKEEFIKKARKVHGDKYDYSKVEYINARTDVEVICRRHGSFYINPMSHLHGTSCKKCTRIDNRGLVLSVGVNDVDDYINHDKPYILWKGMLERCYNPKSLKKCQSYLGVTVCQDWLKLSNFLNWFDNYKWIQKGWQLDKDILVKGNKVYSPQTCCFVPHEINTLLTNCRKRRGEYPVGVSFIKAKQKFVVSLAYDGKNKTIGHFDNPLEAFNAYKKAKELRIKELADKWKDKLEPRVYEALYNYEVEITD